MKPPAKMLKLMVPGSDVQGPKVVMIYGPRVKMYQILENIHYSHKYLRKTQPIVMLFIGVGVSGPMARAIWPYS